MKKSIQNLEVLESWIHRVSENRDMPKNLAYDYMIAVTHTRLSLKRNIKIGREFNDTISEKVYYFWF